MKLKFVLTMCLTLGAIAVKADECAYKIVNRDQEFNSSTFAVIDKVMVKKGYRYSSDGLTAVELSKSGDLAGLASHVFIRIANFENNIQCGLASDYNTIRMFSGANGTAKRLIRNMDIPSCKESRALIQKCLNQN